VTLVLISLLVTHASAKGIDPENGQEVINIAMINLVGGSTGKNQLETVKYLTMPEN